MSQSESTCRWSLFKKKKIVWVMAEEVISVFSLLPQRHSFLSLYFLGHLAWYIQWYWVSTKTEGNRFKITCFWKQASGTVEIYLIGGGKLPKGVSITQDPTLLSCLCSFWSALFLFSSFLRGSIEHPLF